MFEQIITNRLNKLLKDLEELSIEIAEDQVRKMSSKSVCDQVSLEDINPLLTKRYMVLLVQMQMLSTVKKETK